MCESKSWTWFAIFGFCFYCNLVFHNCCTLSTFWLSCKGSRKNIDTTRDDFVHLVECLRSLRIDLKYFLRVWNFVIKNLDSMAELWPREPRNIPLWQQIGRSINYHRWAGLSGATAIVFTAYLENDDKLSDSDKHFIALANQINYIHALVLLAMPIARRPNLVGKNVQVFIFWINEFHFS